jgi:ribosomal protein S18 acetylase RimI-like enzyme
MRVKLSVRPAGQVDAPFLRRVYRSTREVEMAPWAFSDAQKEDYCATRFAAQEKGYRAIFPKAEFLVVMCDGDAVGRLYRAAAAGVLHVLDIALLPPWRNLGVGTHLMRESMAKAHAGGMPLQLQVEKGNPARRLFARLGFREIEDTGIYVRLEWRKGAP